MFALPHPVPLHDIVALAHHLTVDSLAIAANCILISAIIIASPPSLKSYKLILLCSALVDLIAGATQLGAMSRIVPATPVIAHFYVGPCTVVSGRFCHILDTTLFATVNQTLFLIVISFCYRIYVLNRDPPSVRKTISICAASFIPSALWLAKFSSSQDDSRLVVEALRIVRPTYSVDSYVVEGYLEVFSTEVISFIATVCAPMFPTFVIVFVLRRKFIRSISGKADTMSDRTKAMHYALCKVLFLQSLLPLFYFPMVILLFQCLLSQENCSITVEHAMFEVRTSSYIALIAPLISLYYISPYRKFVLSLLPRCALNHEPKQSQSTVDSKLKTTTTTTTSQSTHVI